MYGIADMLRRLGSRIMAATRRFMQGRYGSDKLNTAILIAGLAACFLAMLMPAALHLLLTTVSYVLMGWAIFRMLSRNTYKRYQENCKYLRFMERFKDREHKYFACPRCKQPVRVPRGKGKISITCPKCREKFIKKT